MAPRTYIVNTTSIDFYAINENNNTDVYVPPHTSDRALTYAGGEWPLINIVNNHYRLSLRVGVDGDYSILTEIKFGKFKVWRTRKGDIHSKDMLLAEATFNFEESAKIEEEFVIVKEEGVVEEAKTEQMNRYVLFRTRITPTLILNVRLLGISVKTLPETKWMNTCMAQV